MQKFIRFLFVPLRSAQINKQREKERECDKPQTNKSKTFPYKNQMKYRIIKSERTADKNYELPKNFSQAPNLRFYFYACTHKKYKHTKRTRVCVCVRSKINKKRYEKQLLSIFSKKSKQSQCQPSQHSLHAAERPMQNCCQLPPSPQHLPLPHAFVDL